MAQVRPFRGLRPDPKLAEKVAAPPYDVLNSEEARKMASGNPYSFLHVNKPEIDLPADTDVYSVAVYTKGAENLRRLIAEKVIFQDEAPCFYAYRQIMGGHSQIGLVANASVEEYEQNKIKKHEFTRPVKEDDRVRHIDAQNAQVGPVFLTYQASQQIDELINKATSREAVYDFTAEDGIQHTVWVIDDEKMVASIRQAFAAVPALYVADGHHRSAAAMRIRQQRQKANADHTGNEPYNFFLTVIFPHEQMQILDYNRLVEDLNGHTPEQLLEKIRTRFSVKKVRDAREAKPQQGHQFAMFLQGAWYQLTADSEFIDENDPVGRLDVSILQKHILSPLLNITDPRKDSRIDFVGGIRGLGELEKRVSGGGWAVAFALYPTSIEQLMSIADAGEVMPPKSTWFEPKLRSGLIVHLLDD